MNAPHIIFDRELLRERQQRAARGGAEKFLLERAADELFARLGTIARPFPHAALIETPDAEAMRDRLLASGRIGSADALSVEGAAESVKGEPGQYDLVISLLSMQWLNDLPGALAQIRRLLKPD